MSDALLRIIAGRTTKGLIEVRCRSALSGRIEAREWFPLDAHNRSRCERFIVAQAERLDVYVGAAPRARRDGGKAAIDHVWCLWADIDTPEAVERLRAYKPQPSLVVRSGTSSHVHAYWALTHGLSPVWAERANRRLAHHLGADMKATDAARILRPPGTFNHKTTPANKVETLYCAYSEVSVFDAVKTLPDPPSNLPVRQRPARQDIQSSDPLLGIGAEHYYTALTGRPVSYGNVCCPFLAHNEGKEKSPSMRLYPSGTFYCFGCGVGGSVIQFAKHLWGYQSTRGDDYRAIHARLARELT